MVNSGLCGIFSETCRGHGSECSTYRDSVSYLGQRIKQFLPNQAYKHLSIDTSHKDVGPVCIILMLLFYAVCAGSKIAQDIIMKQCFVCILSGRLANSSPSYAEVEGAKLKFVCTQKNLFCVIKGHG